ncbi:neuritin-like protein [Rana temporaria]|uniref:neuritin-like protein n=1 Tax=Rana temporaria TaxID=8407 RepID=UPI001AAD3FC8|nr:neuritin-like protein [Rana temporaria]
MYFLSRTVIIALALQLVYHIPVNATSKNCDTIYKGFANCLISLGDSMAQNTHNMKVNEDLDDTEELDFICKSWDEFHKCASNILVNCPEDTAAIWESLRQESRKIQYQGNLHDLCSSRNQQLNTMGAGDTGETSKETLHGLAYISKYSVISFFFAGILQWIIAEQT